MLSILPAADSDFDRMLLLNRHISDYLHSKIWAFPLGKSKCGGGEGVRGFSATLKNCDFFEKYRYFDFFTNKSRKEKYVHFFRKYHNQGKHRHKDIY